MPHFVVSVSLEVALHPAAGSSLGAGVTPETHFHGFLTNAVEVSQRLGRPPEASPLNDPGLLIAAYHAWGADMQRHLEGEFCLAVVDHRARRVLLTHDGLGLRPIYYALKGRTLHFASRVDAVARAVGASDLDDRFVLGYLASSSHSPGLTVYRDVSRLGAGQTLLWDGSTLELRRGWDLADVKTLRYRSAEDYDEHFRALLIGAIRARVGRRTWAELSGGLDSSSIVSTLAHERLTEADTVSYVFSRSTTADERRWIRPVVAKYALPWHSVDVDASPPFSVLPDRPVGQPARAIAMWGQFSGLEQVVDGEGEGTVLLSGFGGDQVLAGDLRTPLHLADLLRMGGIHQLLRELRAWQRADPNRRPLRYYAFRLAMQPAWRNRRGLALVPPERTDRAPWIARSFAVRVATEPEAASATGRHEPVGRRFFRDRILQIADAAPELWNHLTDRFDIRYPLLDRSLVEFMFAVPWEEKLQPGQDRVIQRRALADLLPAEIRTRTDKVGPDESIIRGYAGTPDMRERLSRNPIVVERGYVDRDVWRASVDAARVGRLPSLHNFMSAACLELWLQTEGPS
jgi:asparagine synthase (glutamine-hydrolysing)